MVIIRRFISLLLVPSLLGEPLASLATPFKAQALLPAGLAFRRSPESDRPLLGRLYREHGARLGVSTSRSPDETYFYKESLKLMNAKRLTIANVVVFEKLLEDFLNPANDFEDRHRAYRHLLTQFYAVDRTRPDTEMPSFEDRLVNAFIQHHRGRLGPRRGMLSWGPVEHYLEVDPRQNNDMVFRADFEERVSLIRSAPEKRDLLRSYREAHFERDRLAALLWNYPQSNKVYARLLETLDDRTSDPVLFISTLEWLAAHWSPTLHDAPACANKVVDAILLALQKMPQKGNILVEISLSLAERNIPVDSLERLLAYYVKEASSNPLLMAIRAEEKRSARSTISISLGALHHATQNFYDHMRLVGALMDRLPSPANYVVKLIDIANQANGLVGPLSAISPVLTLLAPKNSKITWWLLRQWHALELMPVLYHQRPTHQGILHALSQLTEEQERAGLLTIKSLLDQPSLLLAIAREETLAPTLRLYAYGSYFSKYGTFKDELHQRMQDLSDTLIRKHLTRDSQWVSKLFSDPLLQDEMAKVYGLAIALAFDRHIPLVTLDALEKTVKSIWGTQVFPYWENATDGFRLGGGLIVPSPKPAETFFVVLAHEITHRLLSEGVGLKGVTFDALFVHELAAALGEVAFAEKFDISLAPYAQWMSFDHYWETVLINSFHTIEAHEGARSQLRIIQDVFAARGLTLNSYRALQALFHVASYPPAEGTEIKAWVQEILEQYMWPMALPTRPRLKTLTEEDPLGLDDSLLHQRVMISSEIRAILEERSPLMRKSEALLREAA